MDVSEIYRKRFSDGTFRDSMWKVLCNSYFQKYIPESSTVLEIACGHCEFINNINALRKIGIDINIDSKKHANADVEIIITPSSEISALGDRSVDVIFMSNFLEHITREEIDKTLRECQRLLAAGGKLIILQPNIRYLAKDYWMFIDHITPVDDRALVELLNVIGFQSVKSKPRFLPYTTQGHLPNSLLLLKIYLKLPIFHFFLGKQALLIAEK